MLATAGYALARRSRFTLAAVACVLATGVAACGSSASSSTSSSSAAGSSSAVSAPTSTELAARLKLAKCMRSEGIDVPDPTASGAPPGALGALLRNLLAQYGSTKVQAAINDCRRYLTGSFPNLALTPAALAQRRQEALAFARCMRSHGVDIPDPTTNGTIGLGLSRALGAIDQASPAFKAAASACASLIPARPGAG